MRKFLGNKWLNRLASFVLLMSILLGLSQEYAQGQTNGWSIPRNFSEQPDTASWAPYILCDRYQNLHVFWDEKLESNGGIPQSALFYKTDPGGVWSEPFDLLITPRFEELHAAITPNDMVHLVWSNIDHDVMYVRAPLVDATQIREWSKPFVLASEAYSSNVFVDNYGILYVIYSVTDSETLNHSIYYITSPDSGENWAEEKLIFEIDAPLPSTMLVQLAVDGRGRFHVVYSMRSYDYGKYTVLGYLRSTDTGIHWDFPLTFPDSTTFQGSALLGEYLFGNDEIHLTYDIPERLHQWSSDGGETWNEPIPIVNGVELGAAFGGFNHLVKDDTGILHVVFAESRGVFHSSWNGADWSVAELIDAPVFDPHGQMMAICQGNRLSVVYGGNDPESEIWYSEKILSIPSIPQRPNHTPITNPTPISTPTENILIGDAPIPTKIAVNPSVVQQNQSLLSAIILPLILVLVLIAAVIIYRINRS
jgi:hypothetical protein